MEDLKSYVTSLLDNWVYRLSTARHECQFINKQIASLSKAIDDSYYGTEVSSQILSALSAKLESKLNEIDMIESIARQLTSIKDQCPDYDEDDDEETEDTTEEDNESYE